MKHDYDLKELKKINVRDLHFNIMPRYLYHYTDKEYEEFSLDLLDRLVKKGGSAVDIGAHYGIYSLLAAKKAKKVYAFEPVPENYEILKKNAHDNHFDTIIEPKNLAVSDKKGNVEFNITWASDSAGFYEHPNAEVIRKISVETDSIDNQLKGVDDISFIKIDTEGHEIHVLNGMEETLKRNKQATMLIEFNPECLHNAGSGTRQLIDKILSLDYDIFALHEETHYIVRVTKEVSDEQILQGRTYLNLLCLPKGSWDNPLFVSHSSEIGGAELGLYETVSSLIERDDVFILPTIILPGSGPLYKKFEHLGIGRSVIPFTWWVRNQLTDAVASKQPDILNGDALVGLVKVLNDVKPSVVMTSTVVVPWGGLVAAALGVPHVWSIHEFGDLDHGLTFNYGRGESLRYVDQLSVDVIVNSKAVGDYIKEYISPIKLHHIPLEVSTPVLGQKKLKSVFTDEATIKLVVSASSLMASKGQLEAVKALQELRQAGHKAELLLIGKDTGDYAQEVKNYLKKYHLDRFVHFTGFIDNPADYVAMADIFVMASRSEAFGRVTVEAMLIGKPVVGANSGGTPEIVEDGKTGYLYTPGDSKDLANKIIRLVEKDHLKEFGKNAKERAKANFQKDYAAEIYARLKAAAKSQVGRTTTPSLFKQAALSVVASVDKKNEDIIALQEQYRRDIKIYSDDYNKVYEAYHDLERQHEALNARPAVRVLKKVDSIKKRLKSS